MQYQNLKIKNQNYILKFKNFRFLFVILIFTFYILILPTSSSAQTSSSTPSADIKMKLEELKKEIASKAAQLKQEVNKKLKDKAYVGKVKTKSAQSLTLAASSGPKIVSINQDTIFESKIKSRAKFSQKNILDEDFIAALGDIDETGVLIAKKVILLPTIDYQLSTHLWGQVIAISDKLITIKNRDNKNVAVSLSSNQAVRLNEFVILTGVKTKNEIFDAEFVYIIPQGGFIKPKKVVHPAPTGAGATPSAKVTTPSAKPKSTTR